MKQTLFGLFMIAAGAFFVYAPIVMPNMGSMPVEVSQ